MPFFRRKPVLDQAIESSKGTIKAGNSASNKASDKASKKANQRNSGKQSAASQPHSSAKKRIAIIGSGVSGLTCAHYLIDQNDITIFEANDYIGGHVNTIDVDLQNGNSSKSLFTKSSLIEKSAIDTGFIVFNERTYPNFFRLLHDLQVPFQATDMSFSVKNVARRFEYNGHTINTLLSQRKNVINPKFWRFVTDILQFNKHMKQLRNDFEMARAKNENTSAFTQQTLGDYIANKRYGKLFTDNYLLPMVSAIWSTSLEEVQDFPLVFFAQFFDNHGLLDVVNRPQWFTIKGGSKQYVNKLVTRFVKLGGSIRVNTPVQSVTRNQHQDADFKVNLVVGKDENKQSLGFDEVIFACHADTALKILAEASNDESEVLSHFRFTQNTAVLHTDTSILPKKPLAWASWNYLLDDDGKTNNTDQQNCAKPVLTYHMNILQRLTKQHNYLVTLNHKIDEAQVIKTIDYSHPVFDKPMIEAQKQWSKISASGLHTHFCGAYWFNGFHEDGVRSALRVCQSLGSKIDIKDEVDASHLPDADSAHTPFRYQDLPVKADQSLRKLNKRQILRADTNQELNDYILSLQPQIETIKQKKLGLFARIRGNKS